MSFVMLPREWCSPLHYLVPFILVLSHSCSLQEKRLAGACGLRVNAGQFVSLEKLLVSPETMIPAGGAEPCDTGSSITGRGPPPLVTQKSRKESLLHLACSSPHLLQIFGPHHPDR